MQNAWLRLLCIIAILGACGSLLIAQVSTGTVKGTAVDSSGATVPGAQVELKNTGTNQTRTLTTEADGLYVFPEVPAGQYSVTVKAQGFAEWRGSLTLRITQTAVVQAVLTPATVTSTVEVVDINPVINPESSALADVKEFKQFSTLPVANRSFLTLLNFMPGVSAGGYGVASGNASTRINGLPGGGVDFLIDGMSAADRYTNELQRTAQPVDSIQEVKTSTTNATAEYSKPGSVEVLTKSGTNELHGTAFWSNQNNRFYARQFHQKTVPFRAHNEFGGNIGGPVYIPKLYNGKNRTFFFADLERITDRQNGQYQSAVPQKNWKQGDFSDYTDDLLNLIRIYDPRSTRRDTATGAYVRDPFPGNKIPGNLQNPVAQKVLSYLPDPNVTAPYWTGVNYQRPGARTTDDYELYTFKVDQTWGNQRVAARFTHIDRSRRRPFVLLNDNTEAGGGKNASLSWTSMIRPTLLNELRAGVQRYHQYKGPVPISPPITETLGLPTYPGTVAWPGMYAVGCDGVTWGSCTIWNSPGQYLDYIDRDNPQDRPQLTTNFADNFSWVRSKHLLKFGVFVGTAAVNTFETGQPGGDYNFSGLFTALQDPAAVKEGRFNQPMSNTGFAYADLFLGYVDQVALNRYPVFYTRQKQFAIYGQDSWKVTRTLTVNAGLRWEYYTPFWDKRYQASTLKLDPANHTATVVYQGAAPITKGGMSEAVVRAFQSSGLKFMSATEAGMPESLWAMSKRDFAPRVGLAWQLNSKTVLRGGYGIYYYTMPLVQYHQNTRKNQPFSYSFQSNVDPNDQAGAELAFPAGAPKYASQNLNARTLGQVRVDDNSLTISKPDGGWGILPWDTNYRPQMAQEWNVTLERNLGRKWGARLSYVGTRGTNLPQYDPINVAVPAKEMPGVDPIHRRPYPDFAGSGTSAMDLMRFIGYSNAHSMQSEIRRNFSDGSVFQAFYTFQKVLTTAQGDTSTFAGLELPPATINRGLSDEQRLRMLYAPDTDQARNVVGINGVYPLPFGKGKALLGNANGVLNRIIGGWEISAFFYARSGMFIAPNYLSGASKYVLMPDKTPVLPSGERSDKRWFDASVWRGDLGAPYKGEVFGIKPNSADWEYGTNIPRNFMNGPSFYNIDASIVKFTPITERVRVRLDGQFFNALNHKNLANPNNGGVINNAIQLNSVSNSRVVQVQAKIEF